MSDDSTRLEKAALWACPVPLAVLEAAGSPEGATDARVLWADEAFERLCELPPDRSGSGLLSEIVPQQASVWLERSRPVLMGGSAPPFEQAVRAGAEAFQLQAFAAGPGRFGLVALPPGSLARLPGRADTAAPEGPGRLAAKTAHEFNNLLAVIISSADLLAEAPGAERLGAREARRIREAAERAAALVRELVALSRPQAGPARVVDLTSVVRGVLPLLRGLFCGEVRLSTRLARDPVYVRAEASQLERILSSLASEAAAAMPAGGRLGIEVREVDFEHAWTDRSLVLPAGRYGLLAVSDTGVLCSGEAEGAEPGSGPEGLSRGAVSQTATDCGLGPDQGYISAYAEPGHGTTCKVWLPCPDRNGLSQEHRVRSAEPPRGSETVLVVDDEEAIRQLVARLLRGLGYRVITAADGPAALQRSGRESGKVHLLLADVVMPHMGGHELAGRLRALRPGLKALFMSGYSEGAVVDHGLLEASSPFLAKPFGVSSLARQVRAVLDQG